MRALACLQEALAASEQPSARSEEARALQTLLSKPSTRVVGIVLQTLASDLRRRGYTDGVYHCLQALKTCAFADGKDFYVKTHADGGASMLLVSKVNGGAVLTMKPWVGRIKITSDSVPRVKEIVAAAVTDNITMLEQAQAAMQTLRSIKSDSVDAVTHEQVFSTADSTLDQLRRWY